MSGKYVGGMSEAIAFCSLEEFVVGEQHAQQRHEFVAGRVYARSGGSERHDLLAGAVYELVAPGARAGGCRPFMSNRLLRTPSGNAYYPDVLVSCGRAGDRLYETDVNLVVEVLSPSTAGTDHREKSVAYAQTPSLDMLLLVSANTCRIEVARPTDGRITEWTAYGLGQVVLTPFGDIVIDDLYDLVDRTATTA